MRLINVSTRMFEEFVGKDVPPYAILSHTWGAEEVTFPQYANPESRFLRGYEKIEQSCRLAAERDIGYVWVDTCCIDKSSSAELSEAINSMYNWYGAADVCFVFLSDFKDHVDDAGSHELHDYFLEDDPTFLRFKKCKWFTRGWTLQEMLAPEFLEFYDANWKRFGEYSHMIRVLAYITNIDVRFFSEPQNASVAQKFSWAANRQTTRVEDVAYCLLGLLDINMPLLYGEGEKAFERLQLEILRSSDDESIFAWTDKSLWASGTLATSPSSFADSGQVVPLGALTLYRSPYQMTHQGLQIELESSTGQKSNDSRLEAYLRCYDHEGGHSHSQKLVILFFEPLQTLPGVTVARRVLPGRLEFREVHVNQVRGNDPGPTGKRSCLITKSIMRRREHSWRYSTCRGSPDSSEKGSPSLHFLHNISLEPHDAVRGSDGRDYVGILRPYLGMDGKRLSVVIIRLPQLPCKLAHLELFFPPFPQRMGCDEHFDQVQTGQHEPSVLFEGGQLMHRLSPEIDIFIACRAPSETGQGSFELEMDLDFLNMAASYM